MGFSGNLNGKIIDGTYRYNGDGMENNPGIFQMMKSKSKPIKGAEYPEFNLVTLEGEKITKSDFKNKYLILDFWATWCQPCVQKRPALEAISRNYPNNIEIVSISLDKEKEKVEAFRNDKFPMQWRHFIKTEMFKDAFVREYAPQGLPYGYILNPKGEIVAFGDELKADILEDTVIHILKTEKL